MKRILIIGLLTLFSLAAFSQNYTSTRQVRFKTPQKTADTTASSANDGRMWYDYVTDEFRGTKEGVNFSFGSGAGGGSYWPLSGTAALTGNVTISGNPLYSLSIGSAANKPVSTEIYGGDGSNYNWIKLEQQGIRIESQSAAGVAKIINDYAISIEGGANTGSDENGIVLGARKNYDYNPDFSDGNGVVLFSTTNITEPTTASTNGPLVYANAFGRLEIWNQGDSYPGAVGSWSRSATLDFPNVAAQTTQDLTIAVTGAAANYGCHVGPPTTVNAGIIYSCHVSAANIVTVRANNISSGVIDPASGTFYFYVIKPVN
jgi:hypothetical protein